MTALKQKGYKGDLTFEIVKQIDPNAFIIVSNSSEIIGKGFRSV